MKITDEEIQKDIEVCERATDGPWVWKGERSLNRFIESEDSLSEYYGSNAVIDSTAIGGVFGKQDDKDFIASSRTRWPLYIKELKELREEIKQLKKDICDKAEDTLWISVTETVVDRIANILGEE